MFLKQPYKLSRGNNSTSTLVDQGRIEHPASIDLLVDRLEDFPSPATALAR